METYGDAIDEGRAHVGATACSSSARLPGARPRPTLRRAPPRAAPEANRTRRLDDESQAWWVRLHGPEPERNRATAELHERLRREAWFQIRRRTRGMSEFPRSDLDDLAVESAGDALLGILRKLDDYRGDSQFWTWARRFAQLEAPVSIRRRLGRDRLANDPERMSALPDPGRSLQERAEIQELLGKLSDAIVGHLTARQRAVLLASAIDGVSATTLAIELDTTPGAIHKTLHDARKKLTAQLALP
jgi:RNA polymerase sigma-70 factor, ECF subfamily